ncbi:MULTISPECIES: LuxR family transcriptional regulator [Aeromonas]|uniref:LuxR family transcriptional regulator n=1 Tax=Aeromonas TaxID=642 RepID=UPI0006934689|nr:MULTISPECIES: LuxR family transcriptional regulator [Aeromonas]
MDITRFVETFNQIKTDVELNQALMAFAQTMGFNQYRFALMVPQSLTRPKAIIFSHCNETWVNRYGKENMLSRDPVIYLAMQRLLPIYWQDLHLEPILPNGALALMAEAKACGLHDGVSFPFRGTGGESGILSFITEENNLDIKAVSPILRWVTDYIFNAGIRVVSSTERTPALSAREVECLFWASEGKTAEEMGEILSLSARTVNYHIKEAVQKTNSVNRYQAIAKAAMGGLLRPDLTLAKIEDYL